MLQSTISDLLARWPTFLFIALRVLFIAVAFEFAAWFLGKRLEKLTAPFAALGGERDPGGRLVCLSNRDVRQVVIYKRATEAEKPKAAFDPLKK